jgi:gamma-glutamyltranspeptidase/glutathione hydrolase
MILTPAAVATPHPEATLAARDILLQGGNAFDAAVAAMLTLCVVQSHQVGLGGFGGNLVAYVAKERKVISIDFDSCAPHEFTPDLFKNPNDRSLGYKAIAVPGVLGGLDLILKSHGTLSWSDVTRRAIVLAEEGVLADEPSGRYLKEWTEKTDSESRKHFFPGRSDVPKENEPWIQKDLGKLLRIIASDGIGPFYTGDVAKQIVSHVRAHGGILSERDFAEYQATAVAPVSGSYHGHDVYVPPPPAGGITTLQILKVLEHFDIRKLPRWSAEYFHLLAQAIHLCWADRIRTLGDPDFVNIPIDELLSPEHIRSLAQQVKPVAAVSGAASIDRMNDTANVTVLDQAGNLVTTTATQGAVFGSHVVIPGLGLIMNHGMSRFDYNDPALPNAPRPGKRMHHNMAPTVILKDGLPRFAFGLPGGTKIITVTAQLAINFIDYHTNPHDCAFSQRIHTEPGGPLGVSSIVPNATITRLQQLGYTVIRGQVLGGNKKEIAGNANTLAIDPQTRTPTVASQASPECAMIVGG